MTAPVSKVISLSLLLSPKLLKGYNQISVYGIYICSSRCNTWSSHLWMAGSCNLTYGFSSNLITFYVFLIHRSLLIQLLVLPVAMLMLILHCLRLGFAWEQVLVKSGLCCSPLLCPPAAIHLTFEYFYCLCSQFKDILHNLLVSLIPLIQDNSFANMDLITVTCTLSVEELVHCCTFPHTLQ